MSFSTAWLKSNYVLSKGGWTLAQSADVAGTSLAFGGNNAVGNLLVCGVVSGGTSTLAPTDTAGNTWTFINKSIFDSSGKSVQLFFVSAAIAGANTVTVTGATSIHLYEFSSSAIPSPYAVDVHSETASNSTGGAAGENALSGASMTTTALDDMVVGMVGRKNGTSGVGTNNATWQSPGGDVSGLLEYFTQLAIGAVQANAYDTVSSDPYAIVAAAFTSLIPSFALVQSAPYAGASLSSHTFTWGQTPALNNLLILCCTSDATLNTPAGYSLATSAISGTGCYIFYKVASAGESLTQSIVPTVSDTLCCHGFEYSGMATSNPFDQQSSFTNASGSTTVPCGTTGTTSQANELCIAAAGPHPTTPANTSASWSNSFSSLLDNSTGSGGSPNVELHTGFLKASSTGAFTTTATLTTSVVDQEGCIATFKIVRP